MMPRSQPVIAYGDIVYEPRLLHSLLALDAPVGVVVDLSWRSYWEARMPDPLVDAETLRMDSAGRILELGSRPSDYADIEGQYTGLITVSAKATQAFAALASHLVTNDPTAFMTALLQRAIDDGVHVHAAQVRNGWLEIDSPADLNLEHQRFYRSET